MDTILLNFENSKISDSHRLLLNHSGKIDLKRSNKYFENLNIYYTQKNVKQLYRNNKLEISAATWNEEFQLPDGSYSVSDIQYYFK